jgi:hypothetical protein
VSYEEKTASILSLLGSPKSTNLLLEISTLLQERCFVELSKIPPFPREKIKPSKTYKKAPALSHQIPS